MKTIFISVYHPLISRNILNTGVLEAILNQQDNKVVLLVPFAKIDYYRSIYGTNNVFIEPFDFKISRKEFIFKSLSELLIDTNTKKFHKIIYKFNFGRPFRYYLTRLFTVLFGNLRFIKKLYRFLDYKFNTPKINSMSILFDKYKPRILFSTDIYSDTDIALLKIAKKANIKTVGMVRSWDNNTAKTLLRFKPDRIIVQNRILKDELIQIHSMPKDIIFISGIPHYDYYKQYKPISRDNFFKKMNIPIRKRLILISPAGKKFIGTDWHIFDILKKAQQQGEIPKNVHFLIRLHPSNKVDFGKFVPNENFTIEDTGIKFEGLREKDNELDLTQLDHLIDSLYHSEIIINIVSSLIIDATVMGKPVITIGFNGYNKNTHFARSVDLYLRDDNMEKLLSTGSTPVVKNLEELIKWINKYLSNPNIRSDKRLNLIEQQCQWLDGKSKNRITDYIVDLIK